MNESIQSIIELPLDAEKMCEGLGKAPEIGKSAAKAGL